MAQAQVQAQRDMNGNTNDRWRAGTVRWSTRPPSIPFLLLTYRLQSRVSYEHRTSFSPNLGLGQGRAAGYLGRLELLGYARIAFIYPSFVEGSLPRSQFANFLLPSPSFLFSHTQ